MADSQILDAATPITPTTPAPAESAKVPAFRELGSLGLNAWGGYIHDDFLRRLDGLQGLKKFREMADNDDVCGAALYVIEYFARQVKWRIEAPNEPAEDEQERADWLSGALFEDMSQPWGDILSEILTMLVYGFSVLEIVYKRRIGPFETDPSRRSYFKDGLIGWRKWSPRSQETIQRWVFDDNGGIAGLVQIDPFMGKAAQPVEIPIDRMLLFRTTVKRGNPQGRSILRSAYPDYEYKVRIKEFEGIGIERDLAGIPKITAGEGIDIFNPNDASAVVMLEACQKIVKNIRNNTQTGIVIPFGWEFELVGSAGEKQFNTNDIINRYDTRIAMTMMADFLMIGHTAVGAKAVAEPKQKAFSLAMSAFLDGVCDVVNRIAIPRLWMFNGWPVDRMPKLVHDKVEPVDLGALGVYILNLAKSGAPMFPDAKLQTALMAAADLPLPDEDAVDDGEKPKPIVGPGAAVPEPDGADAGAGAAAGE